MAHFGGDKKSKFEMTDPRWLKQGGVFAELANGWAEREDIIAFVGEGAGKGSPACFVPDTAEMEVDVRLAFGEDTDPLWLPDLRDRDYQLDYPVAMGAILHEAMHARHSKFDLRELATEVKDSWERELVINFEESRIETRGIAHFPRNRAFLRACALKLVLGDLEEDESFASRGHQAFSKLVLLSLARIDAGVLDEDDVTIVQSAAVALWGAPLLGTLRDIWCRAQSHTDDTDWRELHKLALEWIAALEEAGHEPRDESKTPEWLRELLGAMVGGGAPGDEADGDDGDGDGDGGKPKGGLLSEMAEDVATDAGSEAVDEAIRENEEKIAEARAAAGKEGEEYREIAREVFGKGTGPGSGGTSSRLMGESDPTGKERAAAVALAQALERASYRDRVVVKATKVVPPGRLRGRSAMAQAAERSRGATMVAEPWQAKVRKHTEDPTLKIAVMVDISGSMSSAMRPMASLAWILSEASRRIQAKAAMVYYGNSVFPVLAPGEHLDKVRTYTAPDSTEKFNRAAKALQGKMDLQVETGARVVVIVSDTVYTGIEEKHCHMWIQKWQKAGVAIVLVCPQDSSGHLSKFYRDNTQVVELPNGDLLGVANKVGKAAVDALAKANSAR